MLDALKFQSFAWVGLGRMNWTAQQSTWAVDKPNLEKCVICAQRGRPLVQCSRSLADVYRGLLIHRNNLHGYFSTEINCTVIFSRTTWSSFFLMQQVLQICLAYFTSIPLLPTTENILPGHCGLLHCHFILHHISFSYN